jgi:hypothetical protein
MKKLLWMILFATLWSSVSVFARITSSTGCSRIPNHSYYASSDYDAMSVYVCSAGGEIEVDTGVRGQSRGRRVRIASRVYARCFPYSYREYIDHQPVVRHNAICIYPQQSCRPYSVTSYKIVCQPHSANNAF